jgi:hypothetical protein
MIQKENLLSLMLLEIDENVSLDLKILSVPCDCCYHATDS